MSQPPEWTVADPGLTPGWAPPAWAPPTGTPVPAPAPAPRSRRGLVLGLVGAGAVAGAAGAAVLVSAVFLASAEDIGRQMAAGLGEQIGTSIGVGMVNAMDGPPGGVPTDPGTGWSAAVPVQQSPPVAPGELGPDPLLDSYAQNCFAGTLQSCDDLYFQSTPFSEYERYASTCGGRVKPFVVEFCTDLPD